MQTPAMYFAILRDLAATNMSPVCLRQCWNHRSRIDGCAGRFLQQPVSQGRALDLSTRGVARGNLEFNWPPSDRPDAGQSLGGDRRRLPPTKGAALPHRSAPFRRARLSGELLRADIPRSGSAPARHCGRCTEGINRRGVVDQTPGI